MDLLVELATGPKTSMDAFLTCLEECYGSRAEANSNLLSRLIDEWKSRVKKSDDNSAKAVIIEVAESSIAGPLASILRGYFPSRVIVTIGDATTASFAELRTSNNSNINLVNELTTISGYVPLINFGGHAAAAGALFDRNAKAQFIEAIKLAFNHSQLRSEH